ncbi:MAG TPA: MarR family winged helix-turn-helix transcriptional regulator [Candidatus Aquilonibacter sp.]|nr:MarR family winged helix-turn-helix transcriptional regulator [Candidatus Aquilonibacter sp.]
MTNRRSRGQPGTKAVDPDHTALRDLAWFRYSLRKFLRFSERAAKSHGVTPQQHQLLLGVAGYAQGGRATVSQLAEFLQERHHGVSELVSRCVKRGLVRKTTDTHDRRVVRVSLTKKGEAVLAKLSKLHRVQVGQLRAGLLHMAETRKRTRSDFSGRK